jgi:hypothetical protein
VQPPRPRWSKPCGFDADGKTVPKIT